MLCGTSLITYRSFRLVSGLAESFRRTELFIWERVQEQLMAIETVHTAIEVGVVRSVSGTERGSSTIDTSPDPEMHC